MKVIAGRRAAESGVSQAASLTRVAPLALVLAAASMQPSAAETLYVTDELETGVYSSSALDGERIATVRSADALEVLAREGEAAQVRLEDGTEGWMQSRYLESGPPAAARVAQLESENRKLRGVARSSENAQALKKENDELRMQLESARKNVARLEQAGARPVQRPQDDAPIETARPERNTAATTVGLMLLTAGTALGGGFAWGYWFLERRIRRKFGGLKPW